MDSKAKRSTHILVGAKCWSHQGLSANTLADGILLEKFNIAKAANHIEERNKASINVLAKAGFVNKGQQDFKGSKATEMI